MTDTDQTVVLPRQLAADEDPPPPRQDAWLEAPARGVASVGGLGSSEAALARLAWLVTTVAVATVGLVRAGWASLSPAELETWSIATMPWGELWTLRHELDAATAPYYFLVRGWGEFIGSTEFSLRLPSVVAVVLAAGAASALVSRLVNPHAGLLTGLLFAVLPATSRYAHEAGPGPLALALAVLATVALVWFFERPSRWRWFGYLGTVLLCAWVPAVGLLVVFGHGVAVIALRRRVLSAWLLAAVLGSAPAVAVLMMARPPWDIRPGLAAPGLPPVGQLADSLFGVAIVGGVVVGIGLVGISMRRPAGVFTAAAVAPLAALYPVAEFTSLPVATLLLFTVPFWVCLAAMALERAPIVRGLLVIALVALIGLPAQLDLRTGEGHGLAAREIAAVLNENVEHGDAIVFGPGPVDQQTGRDLIERYVAEDSRPTDALLERPPRTDGHWWAQECEEVQRCAGDAPRIWLFRGDEEPDPLTRFPAAKDGLIRANYERVRTWNVRGGSLSLYTLLPAELDRPAPQ